MSFLRKLFGQQASQQKLSLIAEDLSEKDVEMMVFSRDYSGLERALRNQNPAIRKKALECIAMVGAMQLTKDGNLSWEMNASGETVGIRDQKAIDLLIIGLEDEDAAVRAKAEELLGRASATSKAAARALAKYRTQKGQ